ncbi:MAG: hypothetical protein ACLR3S_10575 [Clostridium fessum]
MIIRLTGRNGTADRGDEGGLSGARADCGIPFIMGLAAAVMAGEDAERGLYAAVRSRSGGCCRRRRSRRLYF